MYASPSYPLCTVPCATDRPRMISKTKEMTPAQKTRLMCEVSQPRTWFATQAGHPLCYERESPRQQTPFSMKTVSKPPSPQTVTRNWPVVWLTVAEHQANALRCTYVHELLAWRDPFCVLQVCLMVSKWRPLKSSCLI